MSQLHPQSYIVSKHDTLWSISRALYGDPSLCGELARINDIQDPKMLRTGTALRVPSDRLRRRPSLYTIKKGDTYFMLASVGLGNFTRCTEIADLNQVEATKLRTGMQIVVPADFREP
jgi:LysM domain